MASTNCLNCIYLYKRPGAGNYFIYKCNYWGLETKNIIPQSVIINSIGKKCPFYIKKEINKNKKKEDNPDKEKNDNDSGIII